MTQSARTAKMRMLTFLSLVTIVLPAFVGWSAIASNAQTATPNHGTPPGLLFKDLKLTDLSSRSVKVVPLTAAEVKALDLPQSGQVGADAAEPLAQPFANAAFQRTWERTDKLVAAGAVQRSWYWGPAPNTGALQEHYAEGPGGKRLVQYFDKSRMEINNPNADPNSKFYVTNGLLTVELISGKMQVGNSTYTDLYPADIPVASDTDDANAPTYYSFQGVSNTPLGDHPADNKTGQFATATIARDGAVGDDQTKTTYPNIKFVYFDPNTKHNIPQAIWDFLNQVGPVYDSASGKTTSGPISDPWFYATGLPISDPYWARVKIAGQQQDVLIQAFERRVVTYVPNGVPGFKVQMNNIGQHYYDWRYNGAGKPQGAVATATPAAVSTSVPTTPTATKVPGTSTPAPLDCSDVPPAVNGSVDPLCGPIGTEFDIVIRGFTPNEAISYWFTLPDGEIFGTEEPVDVGTHNGTLDLPLPSDIFAGIPGNIGIWAVTFQGKESNHQSTIYFKITSDDTGNPPGQTVTPTATIDPNASTCTDVPASTNMTITPSNCAKRGTRFLFVGRGFQSGEPVGVYVTAPDQSVIGAPFQANTDGNGVTETISFGTLSSYPLGIYAMTMEGTSTHRRAIGYFKLTP